MGSIFFWCFDRSFVVARDLIHPSRLRCRDLFVDICPKESGISKQEVYLLLFKPLPVNRAGFSGLSIDPVAFRVPKWARIRPTRRCRGRGWVRPLLGRRASKTEWTITDGWFISFTRVACCSFSQLKNIPHHNMGRIQEETEAFQEDEFKRDELEADKDRMMREYRAQLDAERARKLALGRNHSASKSHHKRGIAFSDLLLCSVRKSKESNKQSSRKRKHNRSSESSSSSSSESLSSDDDYESGYGGESRKSRLKKKRKHRSRTKHSSSSSRDCEASGGPV
ncbi:hypothetical protein ZIOFF_000491 [Zingiber officinale]|uniref:Uncharacterized protein n=1 Tax=Zingiber officinale TaxID=94328 RepID=A0A8J5I0A7_ZINOF|nr:hypothetical protein ZIOFF_000491 [Zingiber officinale]